MASAIPNSFLGCIESPKKKCPIAKIETILRCPTMLYVRDDVAPISKKVDSDTSNLWQE